MAELLSKACRNKIRKNDYSGKEKPKSSLFRMLWLFLWNHGKREGYKTLANCAVNSMENFQKHNQPPSMHS